MSTFVLKLYITGRTPRSERVTAQLQRHCKERFGDQCEIVVVDVLEHPHLAEAAKVLATPTLIKEHPSPPRRVIGDLSDPVAILLRLQ